MQQIARGGEREWARSLWHSECQQGYRECEHGLRGTGVDAHIIAQSSCGGTLACTTPPSTRTSSLPQPCVGVQPFRRTRVIAEPHMLAHACRRSTSAPACFSSNSRVHVVAMHKSALQRPPTYCPEFTLPKTRAPALLAGDNDGPPSIAASNIAAVEIWRDTRCRQVRAHAPRLGSSTDTQPAVRTNATGVEGSTGTTSHQVPTSYQQALARLVLCRRSGPRARRLPSAALYPRPHPGDTTTRDKSVLLRAETSNLA